MSDKEFAELVRDKDRIYTDNELADIMVFKSEHIRVHMPRRIFQIIANRLRTGFTAQ